MDVRIVELSMGELKFESDVDLIDHIQVVDPFGNALLQKKVRAEFSLPLGSKKVSLSLQCRQVCKRRLSQHLYHVGVLILNYEEGGDELLRSYIGSGSETEVTAAYG